MSLERTASKVDSVSKIAKPVWGIAVGLLFLGIGAGKFYAEYTDNANNGSPALRAAISELKRSNDLLEQRFNLEKEETNRRLQRLEK